jgi:hypothetical protein
VDVVDGENSAGREFHWIVVDGTVKNIQEEFDNVLEENEFVSKEPNTKKAGKKTSKPGKLEEL